MFKNPVNIEELISTGTTFEVDSYIGDSDDELSKEEYEKEVLNYANMNCVGEFEDEDVYDCSEPFESLASKMTNILENGGVKKRILREGYGDKPEEGCFVKVHYNAYTEFNEEPFDCTYARKKPHHFVLGQGAVIPGLDIAVASMKINEKSQFIITPYYAYGSIGCMDRVQPNSTILFEIELLQVIQSSAAENYENLPPEKKAIFEEAYKYCLSQCAKAKDLFNRNVKLAIKEYNKAVGPMENAILNEYDDQLKQQEILYKLYSNLLICYTRIEEPKKGCINFNKINQMTKGTDMKITAKVYYNGAKCLRMLGEYTSAKRHLKSAYQLEPKNPEILTEFKIIDNEHTLYKQKELKLASAFVKFDNK